MCKFIHGDSAGKRLLLAALCCVVIAVIVLLTVLPTNSQLLSTPSAHKSVAYLPLSGHALAKGAAVKFAAYDVAADAVQITLSVPKGEKDLIKDAVIAVDGTPLDGYDVIYHTTFKCLYVHIIIKDIGTAFNKISVTYNGGTVAVTK